MTHEQVYKKFNDILPNFAEEISVWFPNGKNSIRVRNNIKRDFIFTFENENKWSFETVDKFISKLKGKKGE